MCKYWGIFTALIFLVSCKEDKTTSTENGQDRLAINEVPAIVERYGFNLNDFTVKEDTVRDGDSFGELMLKYKVDYPKIYKISKDFKDTFDVRRINVGKPYVILKSKDTNQVAQVFIYENDAINYTVIDLRDSIVAYKDKKKV
ncbi:MAG: M23 family peptidase, partial [Maribacter sp.]|nr:M23 family peptidase [Maribacter sp.]